MNEQMKKLQLKDGKNRLGQTWEEIFADYAPKVKYANREKEFDERARVSTFFQALAGPNPYRHR